MTQTSPGEIRTSIRGPVGYVIISNPAKRNAMSKAMWESFTAAVDELDANHDVRVILVRGEGEAAFVAGADISQFADMRSSEQAQIEYDAVSAKAYDAPAQARKPVIACIRGVCVGGGLGLAAACDIRICSSDARFRMPAARLGLGYGVEGVSHFVDLVGPQNVLDLFLTARMFDAAEALRIGFVSLVEEPQDFDARAEALALMIADNAPLTLQAVKLAVRSARHQDSQLLKAAHAAVTACARSADYQEGRKAFVEKRAPKFVGA